MPEYYEPWVDPEELREANARCDAELRSLGICPYIRVRPTWNEAGMVLRGRLTDKQIAKYEAMGFYSAEFKAARKALMDKQATKRKLNAATRTFGRKDNFVERDGRLIYSP